MNSLKICFGRRLKQIRKSKKYTQEQLAESVDINLRQMARIEAGESFVTAETLQKICNVLNVTPDNLFRFALYQDIQNKNYTELLEKIEAISSDSNKIEFMNLALSSLNDKDSLEKLKILIKGMELNI